MCAFNRAYVVGDALLAAAFQPLDQAGEGVAGSVGNESGSPGRKENAGCFVVQNFRSR